MPARSLPLLARACALVLVVPACTSVTPSAPRPSLRRTPCLCADADAGADTEAGADDVAALFDAAPMGDDAAMSRSEPFSVEPAAPSVTVHAAERAFLAIRLDRAPGHRAFVELKASGLPPGVVAVAAVGPGAGELGLVLEAADTARPVLDMPFTVEGHAEGVRVSRRLLLTVLPERPVPEE
ncbi:MAG: hypothetical protein ACK5U8_25810 [Deltaproteobacteria bacterium]|jgi:hypothetical protein